MPTVTIPDATYRRLAERAAELNTTADELAARLLADTPAPASAPAPGGLLDFLDGLPAVARTPAEWAEYDRAFIERRAEWDR